MKRKTSKLFAVYLALIIAGVILYFLADEISHLISYLLTLYTGIWFR